ncbi:mitochondrial ribonuclease P catalytic subunit-like [Ornithodoros turicata]|uniref:mitochondrial ribonuclease P catalytic subunit-like n=1 Tax=Ornithodoros turicata TaxID=34597 RepID=UPI0031387B43
MLVQHAGHRSTLSADEWTTIKSTLVKEKKRFTSNNFDASVMLCLASNGNYDLSRSFIEFLRSTGNGPSNITLSYYMLQCEDESEIIACYESIKKRGTNMLDPQTRDRVVKSLCNTKLWRESLSLIDEFKSISLPSAYTLIAISDAAFRDGDFETAWKMLQGGTELQQDEGSSAMVACVQAATKLLENGKADEAKILISKLLQLLSCKELVPSEQVAVALKEYFEKQDRTQWQVTFSEVSRQGTCSSCMRKLEQDVLTAEEFAELRSAVLNSVMKGFDLFINTTPEELSAFESFMRKRDPYDVVLDGLNVAMQGTRTPKERAMILLKVVEHYAKLEGKRVLVIGRKHMMSWPRNTMRKINGLATCYFTEDISEDDPFLLCAAVLCGPHAVVVSRDLLRNHNFKLKNVGLNSVFQRWQKSHQEVLFWNSGKMTILKPPQHRLVAHGSDREGWHIPYSSGVELQPYEIRRTWLCIRRMADDNKQLGARRKLVPSTDR